ncbi:MAG: hypothetical protein WBX49_02860, partial [Candidatus Deferrimicrobiaceae bacterium]
TRPPALNLTAPLLLRLLRQHPGTRRRCGGFPEAACGARVEYPRRAGSVPASETGSERTQGRERS